jgi:uncharacterized protein (TIGR02466 family)
MDQNLDNFNLALLSPIPIYIFNSSYRLNEEERKFLDQLEYYDMVNGNYVSKDRSLLNHQEFFKLKQFLTGRLEQYLRRVVCISEGFSITDSWSAKNPKGTTHHQHTHTNSIFSGVYYANCNSGELIFHLSPVYSKEFNFSYKRNNTNEVNATSWSIPVKTGDVVIFPSWVMHSVGENIDNVDREIIGFNAFVSDTLGDELQINRLNLKGNR